MLQNLLCHVALLPRDKSQRGHAGCRRGASAQDASSWELVTRDRGESPIFHANWKVICTLQVLPWSAGRRMRSWWLAVVLHSYFSYLRAGLAEENAYPLEAGAVLRAAQQRPQFPVMCWCNFSV